MSKISRRTEEFVIWQGEDLSRITELAKRAKQAADDERRGVPRLMHEPSAADLAREHDEAVDEARPRAITLKIRELGRRRWRELMLANPPRPGNESDQQMGVNEDDFADALIRASLIEPLFPTAEELDEFVDNLNAGVFEQLYIKAFMLNKSGAVDPKASLASALTQQSDET